MKEFLQIVIPPKKNWKKIKGFSTYVRFSVPALSRHIISSKSTFEYLHDTGIFIGTHLSHPITSMQIESFHISEENIESVLNESFEPKDTSKVFSEKKSFPNFLKKEDSFSEGFENSVSTSHHAILNIAYYNYALYDDVEQNFWVCQYEELTKKGKQLFKMLSEVYKSPNLVQIQTWIKQTEYGRKREYEIVFPKGDNKK